MSETISWKNTLASESLVQPDIPVLCCLVVYVWPEQNLLCKYNDFLDSRVSCSNCLLLKTTSSFTVSQPQLSKCVIVEVNLERSVTDLAALFIWNCSEWSKQSSQSPQNCIRYQISSISLDHFPKSLVKSALDMIMDKPSTLLESCLTIDRSFSSMCCLYFNLLLTMQPSSFS